MYRVKLHVAIAERYPFMRVPGDNWTCRMVAERFASLPPDEWDAAAHLFEGLPMATARLVLEHLLARRHPYERWELYEMPVVDARTALTVRPPRPVRRLRRALLLLGRVERSVPPGPIVALLQASRCSVIEALTALDHPEHERIAAENARP
jgi:hypothetical protein